MTELYASGILSRPHIWFFPRIRISINAPCEGNPIRHLGFHHSFLGRGQKPGFYPLVSCVLEPSQGTIMYRCRHFDRQVSSVRIKRTFGVLVIQGVQISAIVAYRHLALAG